MLSRKAKFSSRDLIQKLIWALVGYLANLYGLVDLPVDQAASILAL